jgi:hypothetical protein
MIEKDQGHPDTTSGSARFQQPVPRGDNRVHVDPETGLPVSPEAVPPNGGAPGTNAQTADLDEKSVSGKQRVR